MIAAVSMYLPKPATISTVIACIVSLLPMRGHYIYTMQSVLFTQSSLCYVQVCSCRLLQYHTLVSALSINVCIRNLRDGSRSR